MKRSPELEALAAADEADIRDPHAKRGQMLRGALLLLGGAVAIYFIFMSEQRSVPGMLDGDEEFQTTTFRPPSFVREGDEPPPLEVPLPPPPPDPVAFDVPPPPEPVDEFPGRYRSGMVIMDESQKADGEGGLPGAGGVVAGEDRASRFLAAASSLGDRSARARQLERIDALIAEGTMIPGILETAINSDLPGQIRAIVSHDVYSFDGRRVLIPTGSRLIGEYQSAITRGQKRVFVVWTRLIRNDGVSVRLNSIGADGLGRSGMTGHVDNKFIERFSSAIMLSVVGAGASYLAGYGIDSAQANTAGQLSAEEYARTTLAASMSDMANTALAENIGIPPTISVPQGEIIFVYVRQDLDFSALYDDPVTEAMKEIKRERGIR